MNILIPLFKFAGDVGYKVLNLFQFNSIVNSAKKRGAPQSAGPGATAQFAHCLIRPCRHLWVKSNQVPNKCRLFPHEYVQMGTSCYHKMGVQTRKLHEANKHGAMSVRQLT